MSPQTRPLVISLPRRAHWESGGIKDEQQCLLLWASIFKEWTMIEKARAEARQQHLDVREELLTGCKLPSTVVTSTSTHRRC
jgi:hypothetical protein